MRPSRLLLLALGCGLLAVSSLQAQTTPAAAPAARVSLRVLSMEGIVTDLAVRSPAGRTRVVAKASAFGPEIVALVVNGEVTFHRHPQPPSADPKIPEPPAARFAVQPDVGQYLVIVAASGTGDTRTFQVYAIPDSGDAALSPGHARVVNFTDGPLAVRLATAQSVVAASRASALPFSPDTDGHVALQLAIPGTEEPWRLVSSTRVVLPGDRRPLLIVTPSRPRAPTGGVEIAEPGVLELKLILDAAPQPPSP